MPFTLASPAFAPGAAIPARYTCDGDDRSPPLEWRDAPPDTRSFALVVDDPDAPDPAAPRRVWVHWVLWDIPAGTTSLPEAVPEAELPSGTHVGVNDSHDRGYGGPCPPIGEHRYFHKLYALDTMMGELTAPTKGAVLAAMEGHVLAEAQLMGTYRRPTRASPPA